ncbi:KamA family radical SAM protein [Verrucomicrobiales bacterium]|nr:KamA family radical SAM protein [Verrucomicrobiales bacterium]
MPRPEDIELPSKIPAIVLGGCTLFPHCLMPLFIFEQRYRDMLEYALESDRVFAVAAVPPGIDPDENPESILSITTAGLIRACVQHEDGTSHLMLQGLKRVRITDWDTSRSFRIGKCEPVECIDRDTDSTRVLANDLIDITTQLSGEDSHMPVPGLVHRYPDRVLFLVTDRCASYCRYCTRSRVVSGAGEQTLDMDHEAAFKYLEEHTEVRDVLLSGGDPLLLSDGKLEKILSRLRAIPHIEFLRIGSRIPLFLPQRITPELCQMLQKYHPLFLSVHANHPRELTMEVKEGLERLSNHGIPLGNQSVLIKGVNDDLDIMRSLVHKLLMCRVRPYYLYQMDLIEGSAHLQVPVAKGIEIIEGLRGHTSGYAIPQYVIDAPGGGGKVPINPDYMVQRNEERVIVRNYEGKTYEYPEPAIDLVDEDEIAVK